MHRISGKKNSIVHISIYLETLACYIPIAVLKTASQTLSNLTDR